MPTHTQSQSLAVGALVQLTPHGRDKHREIPIYSEFVVTGLRPRFVTVLNAETGTRHVLARGDVERVAG